MANQNKQVQTTEKHIHSEIQIPDNLLVSMQKTIDSCVPATSKAVHTMQDSLIVANGLNALRTFFQNEEVKKLVETMQDSTLGFLTDREPATLARVNANRSPQYKKQPYSYDEIVEALIPPMLEGYRFTGNEINIISGNGMPVKNGKHRKINELVKGFTHSVGGPKKDGAVAKMRCQAKWSFGGEVQSIGYDDDVCIIHVEFGKYDGIDKLIGLAESKLFSRVLTRVSGKLVIEGDVHDENSKDGTQEQVTVEAKNILTDGKSGPKKQQKKEAPEKKAPFVEKLQIVVDDKEYSSTIQSLLKEGKIKAPDKDQNVLRTKDEAEAKAIYELIEQQKGFQDAEGKSY